MAKRRRWHTFVPFDKFESKALSKMKADIEAKEGKPVNKADIVRACVRFYVNQVYGPEFVVGTPGDILDRTKIKKDG